MCPHFHLSLQSGCDATLEENEPEIYKQKNMHEKCTLLRKYFDHPALTTDVIVGFPMETEEEFQDVPVILWTVSIFMKPIFLNIPEDREPRQLQWMVS